MAKAMSIKNNDMKVVSVIGDSTFFHSGMTSLMDVTYNKSNVLTVILDNRITGMTGHQENPGSGYDLKGEPAPIMDIETIVRALGVKNVRTVDRSVIITADEPGMHSSQNEQDNRNYARHAKMPMFEPSDSQEAKDMLKDAYEVSETYDCPVLYRMTTRVCHSKSIVQCEDRVEVDDKEYVKDIMKNCPLPAHARVMQVKLAKNFEKLAEYTETSKWNYIEDNQKEIGVIASGVAFRYAKEVFGDSASYLKLGFSYPLPKKLIAEFADKVKKIYVLEENDQLYLPKR